MTYIIQQTVKVSPVISTPMPLAGHDGNMAKVLDGNYISTPMPLAGHDP